ncbi:hypothetical protein ABEB36_005001 [Hypothenemus hampei]|uniref:Exosome complex component RRP45 n=1 Tax=Hypothenemus hampei TaxID=57062 RepID=A0ABD1EWL5_HYPHA
MSNFRKTIISNAEKQFLIKNLRESTRLDGRAFNTIRDLKIEFGKDWGCCNVSLGKTKVLAQVTCDLQEPKSNRPSEGTLNINLELNPMADPSFEAGRQSDLSAQLNRLLEKCLKDSKAIDLESLCIQMKKRVWSLRIDLNVLNHDGNILDCASIAALAALSHFRRPDVTSDGVEFKIHSIEERDPIPIVVYHYPVYITYAIFSGGDFLVVDPTLLEEGVAEAFLSIGLNSYDELCGLHLGGKAQLSTNVILEITNKATKHACGIINLIKKGVELDTKKKLSAKETGFHKGNLKETNDSLSKLSISLDHWTTTKTSKKKKKSLKLNTVEEINNDCRMECDDINQPNHEVIRDLGVQTTELVHKGTKGEWIIIDSDSEEGANPNSSQNDIIFVETSKVETIKVQGSDSEEENVIIVCESNQEKNVSKSPKKKKAT